MEWGGGWGPPGMARASFGKVFRAMDGVELGNLRGRPASIPERVYDDVFRWRSEGLGYQRISRRLEGQGIFTTRSSVHRLIAGLPPYQPDRHAD